LNTNEIFRAQAGRSARKPQQTKTTEILISCVQLPGAIIFPDLAVKRFQKR